ncbi:MAG: diguanylate cyclase [Leptolyngbya sp. PLA1]|nr:diguanylate cyclase [Leptolyngbya sp. PLA1]
MTSDPMTTPDASPLVLVVDDTPDVYRLLKVKLRHEAIRVEHARSGADALTMAHSHKPDAILLDIDMPGMDGIEVLRLLKVDPELHDIPVLMLSAHSSPEHKTTTFELGAVDYITKPFEFVELQVRLRSALRVRELIALLAQRAQLDGLTGLWNRAFFDSNLRQCLARSERHQHALSLALFDIDHFKTINDMYGHPAGDHVLSSVARTLQRECRGTDYACRYGGEEFAMIMPDTDASEATLVCERIRAAIERMEWPGAPGLRVTISAGVVGERTPRRESADVWVKEADRCLYQAKHEGRNRVVRSPGVAIRPANQGGTECSAAA